jgi:hypothetical protein
MKGVMKEAKSTRRAFRKRKHEQPESIVIYLDGSQAYSELSHEKPLNRLWPSGSLFLAGIISSANPLRGKPQTGEILQAQSQFNENCFFQHLGSHTS